MRFKNKFFKRSNFFMKDKYLRSIINNIIIIDNKFKIRVVR